MLLTQSEKVTDLLTELPQKKIQLSHRLSHRDPPQTWKIMPQS